jgi:hypothetical protein
MMMMMDFNCAKEEKTQRQISRKSHNNVGGMDDMSNLIAQMFELDQFGGSMKKITGCLSKRV